MTRFLVTGLPRSRTAWFALATGALHEPISQQGYAEFAPKWRDGMGVSDAGAGMHLHAILSDLKPKTLIVERPCADVFASMITYCEGRFHLDRDALWGRLAMLEHALAETDHPLIKRVRYADLEVPGVALSCMKWLGVKPVNLAQMLHMRVESDLSFNLSLLKQRAA